MKTEGILISMLQYADNFVVFAKYEVGSTSQI